MLLGLAIAVAAITLAFPTSRAAAACSTLPQDKGQAAYDVKVDVAGDYILWLRMAMQAPDHDSVFVQVDAQCPVNVGDKALDGLSWVDYANGNIATPVDVSLTAGAHTVKIAGREAGVVVDKVMFVGDPNCVPTGLGDNCLAATTTPAPLGSKPQTSAQLKAATPTPAKSVLPLVLKVTGVVVALGTLAFVIVKFIAFERRVKVQPVQIGQVVVGGEPYKDLHITRRLSYFVRHHWLMAAICGAVFIVSVAVSIVAAGAYPIFEAESGTLSGGAKVTDWAGASGGKAVLFQTNPVAASSGGTAPGSKSSGSSSSSGGSSSGGGSSNSGGTGTCAVTTSHVPDGPDGMGGCWPGPSNTGPNASQGSMAAYSGSCTINSANVTIDSKVINCSPLSVGSGAANLVIKNSYIKGGIISNGSSAFTVQDSLLDNAVSYPACGDGSCSAGLYACGDPNNATTECGVGYRNYTILRTEIINSNRAAYCESTCTIQDSYFHGTNLWPDSTNLAHASSVRNEQYLTLRHNSLGCDYTGPFPNGEIGCSADMSGYPDFAPIMHDTIDKNLFLSNNVGAGFCVYGGGTNGKPYSGDANNATYIVFTNNVFQRGANGICGSYGPVTDFITGRTGNVWTNNKYDNGDVVDPA